MRSQRALALFTILAALCAGPVQGEWISDQVDLAIPVRDEKSLSADVCLIHESATLTVPVIPAGP
jgi:hypothetical protein